MKLYSFKTLILATSISVLGVANAFALTDEQALSEGMTPVEEYMMTEMKAALTPGLSKEGVLEAARRHRLVISINKAAKGPEAQTLTMFENGVEIFKEKISTGREKREKAKSGRVYISTTPKGFFRPTKMYRDYMSYTWKAPMPNSVFFIGGIAIHAAGKSAYKDLGTRASGGCVRTILETSKMIREKIMETGRGVNNFKILRESEGRNRIANNMVSVDQLSRHTGDILNAKVNSWDTVIIVYEE